jgi:hypothetical protein
MATEISLKSLLVPSKTVEVEYPGFPEFKIDIGYMSRETLISLRKKSTKNSFKGKTVQDDFNEELFLELYVDAAIRGWKGLRFSYVNLLVPVDVSKFDPLDELAYSKENALMLMKNSSQFDNFISEQVNDLANFTTSS